MPVKNCLPTPLIHKRAKRIPADTFHFWCEETHKNFNETSQSLFTCVSITSSRRSRFQPLGCIVVVCHSLACQTLQEFWGFQEGRDRRTTGSLQCIYTKVVLRQSNTEHLKPQPYFGTAKDIPRLYPTATYCMSCDSPNLNPKSTLAVSVAR